VKLRLELRDAASAIAIKVDFTGIFVLPERRFQPPAQFSSGQRQNAVRRQQPRKKQPKGLYSSEYQTRQSRAGCKRRETSARMLSSSVKIRLFY
jgi:hypothetical protein